MANPKFSSLALIAFLLIATASLAKSQVQANFGELILSVRIIGALKCDVPPGPGPAPPAQPVSLTLSCDGGQTPLVPPVMADAQGIFTIKVDGLAAKTVDPMRCFIYALPPVPGCRVVPPGQVLRAPIVPVDLNLPLYAFIKFYVAFSFGPVPKLP